MKKTRSFNFLLELLICLLFFLVTTIGCVTIFYNANGLSNKAKQINESNLLFVNVVEQLSLANPLYEMDSNGLTAVVSLIESKESINGQYFTYLIEIKDTAGNIIKSDTALIFR